MAVTDLKATLEVKRMFNLARLTLLYRFRITGPKVLRAGPYYCLAFWAVTHIKAYWVNRQKTFPYLKLKRMKI